MQPEQPTDLNTLWNLVKDYVYIRLQYFRLIAVEKVSKMMADVISSLGLIVCILMAFLGACFTLACYLSELLQSFTWGFGLVSLLLTFIALLTLWTKDKFEKKMVNLFISRFFDKHCDEEDPDEDC
ncbi:phage holin family protein [Pedobacter sp. KBW06]|uniref:phage holin family protein n=1 Tax=Pedobacter sp. KBW06 TaxID=2153359 RepID=UPI000F594DE9|nr:phage holin family protein [Pedobacter sp. KBW06]RQO73978.1 phage holin family protein [Pedobacter sp. KBW06]